MARSRHARMGGKSRRARPVSDRPTLIGDVHHKINSRGRGYMKPGTEGKPNLRFDLEDARTRRKRRRNRTDYGDEGGWSGRWLP